LALVNGAGAQHGEDEIARKFFLEVINVNLGSSGFNGFLVETLEFLLLADVSAEADHLGIVFFLDPRHEDRGVKTARISENDFHVAEIKAPNQRKRKVEMIRK
jgi:hypothetical protein